MAPRSRLRSLPGTLLDGAARVVEVGRREGLPLLRATGRGLRTTGRGLGAAGRRLARTARHPLRATWPARLALLLALVGGVSLAVGAGWGGPRRLVARVTDELGMRLVAGHAERIAAAAEAAGVEPELLAGIMYAESRGRSGQTSSAGCLGLMQLSLPAASDAARRAGLPEPTTEQLLHDDDRNVLLGAHHLRWLLDHAGAWDLEAVLVSYNAGRTRLFRWIDDAGSYARWRDRELERVHAGADHTGALTYAIEVLAARDRFRDRGELAGTPAPE